MKTLLKRRIEWFTIWSFTICLFIKLSILVSLLSCRGRLHVTSCAPRRRVAFLLTMQRYGGPFAVHEYFARFFRKWSWFNFRESFNHFFVLCVAVLQCCSSPEAFHRPPKYFYLYLYIYININRVENWLCVNLFCNCNTATLQRTLTHNLGLYLVRVTIVLASSQVRKSPRYFPLYTICSPLPVPLCRAALCPRLGHGFADAP